jgi:hypothetical protein
LNQESDGIDVVALQQLWRHLIRLMPEGRLCCPDREMDEACLPRWRSGELPEGGHTKAGHANDCITGEMSLSFLHEQRLHLQVVLD